MGKRVLKVLNRLDYSDPALNWRGVDGQTGMQRR
jgi:hypothetical protein